MSNPSASPRLPRASVVAALAALGLAAGCGPSGDSSTALGNTGIGLDGEPVTVFVDENQAGEASTIKIKEVRWGRLVDIYDQSADGTRTRQRRDFVINDQVVGNDATFRLETNPFTEREELTILAEAGTTVFDTIFESIQTNAKTLIPTGVGSTFLPPFPLIPRNAALSVQFTDLLDASTINNGTVRVTVGSPPVAGFEARVFPDPNHGAFLDGKFFTTRVLIDTTITQFDSSNGALAINAVGLPPSSETGLVNAAIRIPTQVDPSVGQFQILRNRTGARVEFTNNGPTQENATLDVLRAFRTGGAPGDPNNGFLRDDEPPTIRGVQGVTVTSVSAEDAVAPDPDLFPEFSSDKVFVVAFDFSTAACAVAPNVGDFLIVNGSTIPEIFAEVTRQAAAPQGGQVIDVRVKLLRRSGITLDAQADDFVNAVVGRFESTFRPGPTVMPECFVSISPPPSSPPTTGVSREPRITLRFSEPMDPGSVSAFDNFRLDRESTAPVPDEIVVGAITPDPTLREFRYTPTVPLDYDGTPGSDSSTYFLNVVGGVGGLTDLAGNALEETLDPALPVTVGGAALAGRSGGVVLRFDTESEFGLTDGVGNPAPEIRGQFERDLARGVLLPRAVMRGSRIMDPAQPMFLIGGISANCGNAFGLPINQRTPLNPRGTRMMTLWRYVDMGVELFDESLMNIDVEGLSWVPSSQSVLTEFFAEFEMTLSHGNKLPDGGGAVSPSAFPMSGLDTNFSNNVLSDPASPAKVVHPRARGYLLSPSEAFMAASDAIGNTPGLMMAPYPWNRGVAEENKTFYTWRDTAITSFGGDNGNGTPPLDALTVAGLPGAICLDAQIASSNMGVITPIVIHGEGTVPSIGLPLLMDFKCFPQASVGLNVPFTVFMDTGFTATLPAPAIPAYRVYSAGGDSPLGPPVTINPDAANNATGGFNNDPFATDCTPAAAPLPLGASLPGADNVAYFGQLDYVTRVSRAHTRWFATGTISGDRAYTVPILEPAPSEQPLGTGISLAYRGADTVLGNDRENANLYDAYGNELGSMDSGEMGTGRVFVADNMGTCTDPSDDADENGTVPPVALDPDISVVYTNNDKTWKSSIAAINGSDFFQVRVTFVSNAANGQRPELSTLAIPFQIN